MKIKELSQEAFETIMSKVLIQIDDSFETPPEILWVNGNPIATLGNFSASTGKAKAKKTFNVSAIVCAALKDEEVLQYSALLPNGKKRILYIDTEQSRFHCVKVLSRIVKQIGISAFNSNNLIFVSLREQTPEMRISFINEALKRIKGLGLVIIDGIRDLLFDINNPTESTEIISLLMKWSSEHNLHIHCVLHLNKNDDNARGHLGTELNNKAETVLLITKSTKDKNVSEVWAKCMRNKEFTPFAFSVTEDGLLELAMNYTFEEGKTEQPFSLLELSEEQHRQALERGIGDNLIQGYSNLIAALKDGYDSIGFERGKNAIVALNKFLVNKRIIIKEGGGYRYNRNFVY